VSGSSRLTVLGGGRRADLSLPADVPLADLIAEVCDLVLGRSPDALPEPLVLSRPTGPALPLDRSLGELEILDGDVLVLRAPTEVLGEPVVDDLAEAVGEALGRRPGRYGPDERRRLVPLAGALIAGLGGVLFLGPLAGALGPLPLLAFALALLAAGALLERISGSGQAGAAMVLSSLPWFAAAPADLLDAGGPGLVSAMAGSGVGLLLGATLALLAAPRLLAALAAVGVAAAAAAAAGTAVLGGARTVDVAAVAAVVLVAALYVVPRVAMRASGLLRVSDRATASEVGEAVERGRRLLPALLGGAGLAATFSVGVLAWYGQSAALVLAAAVAGCLLLRARSLEFTAEVVAVGGPGLLAAALALTAAAARLAGLGGAAVPLVTVLGGLALALAGALAGSPGSPGWRRFMRRAEVATALALIPLCLVVVGFFGAVAALGESLGLSR